MKPVEVLPVIVIAVVDKLVTSAIFAPNLSGVKLNAVGNVYEAVPFQIPKKQQKK